jgi:hypothetical protein
LLRVSDLSKTQLTEGHQIMLMGTADVVAAPTQSIVFLEDMTDTQKAEKVITEFDPFLHNPASNSCLVITV